MTSPVYRAPMRSRRDDVDVRATIERALRLGLCGFGGELRPGPPNVGAAVKSAERRYDTRVARRIARFAEIEDGAFVWTRDGDLLYWLGRITGPWSYDASTAAAKVDLVHVRPCQWSTAPVLERDAPAAVVATFGRGGRNLQRIRDPAVGPATEEIWTTEPNNHCGIVLNDLDGIAQPAPSIRS